MSKQVDERVVSMQFDNKHFESNVQTSLNTIDKLKQSLRFDGATKGLSNVSAAARNVDMSSLGGAIETVRAKFSALQVMGVTALSNITNSVVNTGKRMVSALTIDPITTGFSEYETKINSIQTIMSNTASKGTTMADVTRVIGELNTYADKTIYNFAEMTRNIGTFTAAGVGLEESAAAIQGIANLAAASGSSSQQASTAMYQLSQALASGTVKLMDWNSVVNAGMGGEKFQEALKATAKEHGIAVDDIIKKNGSFRESLQEGWLSADILNETLQKFTVEGAKEYADSMVKSGKYTKEQADALIKEAQAMEDAATKVKTFTQLWDTLKEGAQSGWSQTWEIVVGDFEQAKEMLSNVADTFGKIIGDSADARNKLLEGALGSQKVDSGLWSKFVDDTKTNVDRVDGVFKNMDGTYSKSASALQKALTNTAKAHNIDIESMIEKEGSFEATLKNGWLTAELMTETLGKFNVKNEESAEKLKTLSGYTEEEVNALIALGSAAEGAESPLSDIMASLNKPTGRELLIESFKNAFKGLSKIVVAVKDAFRDIFPPTTSEQLYKIIEGIHAFSEKLIISDETAENVKRTFKGVFALLDIGVQVIKAVVTGVAKFIGALAPAGRGILSFTAGIGDFVVKLRDSLKASDAFAKVTEKISQVLSVVASVIRVAVAIIKATVGSLIKVMTPAIDKVKDFVTSISDTFSGFDKIDTSGLDKFAEKIEIRFAPFETLGKVFKSVFGGVIKIFQKIMPLFSSLGSFVGKAFGGLTDTISTALQNGDFSSVLDLINTGLFGGLLVGIKKFIDSLTSVTDGAGGLLDNIKGILDGVKGSLEAYQSSLKANTLLKIAGAIGILAAALVAMSFIDSDKLTMSLAAMTTMFVELFTSMGIFQNIMSGKGFNSMGQTATMMIALSVSVLILSTAMTKLAKLDHDGIIKGLAGVAGMAAVLVTSAKVMSSSSGKMIKGATGIIAFSVAIVILANAVEKMSALDTAELTKGLIGVGVLCAELAGFLKLANFDGAGLMKGVGIILLATAINILASAVGKFGSMDVNSLVKGLAGVGVVLTELAIFTKLTSGSTKIISTAIGLTVLGAAMLIFSKAISSMGNMSWEQLGKGLLSMAVALTAVTVAMNFMPSNTILTGVGLIAVATALNILSTALSNMGNMSWEGVAKSLIALAGGLAIIATAMHFMVAALPGAAAMLVVAPALILLATSLKIMGSMSLAEVGKSILALAGAMTILAVGMTAMIAALPGAAAMLVVSAALAIFAPVLKTLGSMSLGSIGKGLLALAGIFAVIGVAGLVLAPLTPVILGLSVAITMLGIGCTAISVSILLFSTALSALAISGTAGAAALVAIVTSLISLIPVIIQQIGVGIISFANVISSGGPAILAALTTVILALVAAITTAIPPLMQAVGLVISELLKLIVTYVPQIIDAGIQLILGLLKGIRDNIGEITTVAIDIILNFISAIGEKIPDIVQSGIDLMLDFINGMADGIRENTDKTIAAVDNLMDSIIYAIKQWFGHFISKGKEIIGEFIGGIKNKYVAAKNAVKDCVSKCIDGIKEKFTNFKNAAKDLVEGFKKGIEEKVNSVKNAAKNMVSKAVDAVKDFLGINSPSRVFAEIGRYSDEGLAKGLSKFAGVVSTAAKDVGKDAMTSLSKPLSNISDIINSDIDIDPTIRPVLDLSNIRSGANAIDGMLSRRTLSIDANAAGSISAAMTKRQNGSDSSEVVSAINALRKDMASMPRDSVNINGVTYDDGSNINNAVKTIVRAAKISRRV